MIDDDRGLAIFVAVVKAGSFGAAARQLKLSTSVVSHHVSRLEEKLGVTLFFRSTRSLSLEDVQPERDAGVLKEVLPGWTPPDLGIFPVWPDIGPQKQLTRRFLDDLVAHDTP